MATVRGYVMGYITGKITRLPARGEQGLIKMDGSGAIMPFFLKDVESPVSNLNVGDNVEFRHKEGLATKVRKVK